MHDVDIADDLGPPYIWRVLSSITSCAARTYRPRGHLAGLREYYRSAAVVLRVWRDAKIPCTRQLLGVGAFTASARLCNACNKIRNLIYHEAHFAYVCPATSRLGYTVQRCPACVPPCTRLFFNSLASLSSPDASPAWPLGSTRLG